MERFQQKNTTQMSTENVLTELIATILLILVG